MFSIFSPSKEKAARAFTKGFESGDFGPALKIYKKLIKKTPNDYESLHNVGYIFLTLENSKSAIDYFVQANKINESSLHWNNLGRAYQQAKEYISAKEAYGNAMRLDMNDPQPWYNKTVCLREMGEVEESVSELTKMIKNHPMHSGANNDLALHYEDMGSVDKAIHHLEKAIANTPDYVPCRLNLVRILCEQGKYPESTKHLECLSEQGVYVEVSANNGDVKIAINGAIFFEGSYDN